MDTRNRGLKSRSCGSVDVTRPSSSTRKHLFERKAAVLCEEVAEVDRQELNNHHPKSKYRFFDQLSDDIIMYNIMDYIGDLRTLLSIGTSCKRFRRFVCDEKLSSWEQFIVHLCVDDYCPFCMLRGKNYDAIEGALSLIRSYPIRRINIHCFVSDVSRILEALPARKTVYQLCLKLTNKICSPSLYDSMSPELDKSMFDQIRMLTLDSCNLSHVSLAGRVRLLELLGSRLEYLKFIGLTPSGIFKCVSSQCPELRKLRVDKVKSDSDFEGLICPTLEELILCRAQFVPLRLQNLPNLQRLRYTSAQKLERVQIESFVLSLPEALTHVDIEVPSSHADHLLLSIAERLHRVQSIIIESASERATISSSAMRAVADNCHELESFEIYSAQSVCDLILSCEAYMVLSQMKALRGFKIKLKEHFVDLLPQIVSNSSSLENITFWERNRWLGNETWEKIQSLLSKLCLGNTRDVKVKLVDSSLGPFFSAMKIKPVTKQSERLSSTSKPDEKVSTSSHTSLSSDIKISLLDEEEEDEPLEF